jgi:hypothetical protein
MSFFNNLTVPDELTSIRSGNQYRVGNLRLGGRISPAILGRTLTRSTK